MEQVDWQRVAQEVRRRRLALGLARTAADGVSPATWTKLENARQRSYKPFLLANVERALRWPPGTIERIAAGRDLPPDDPAAPSPSLEERVRRLEERVDDLEARIGRRG